MGRAPRPHFSIHDPPHPRRLRLRPVPERRDSVRLQTVLDQLGARRCIQPTARPGSANLVLNDYQRHWARAKVQLK